MSDMSWGAMWAALGALFGTIVAGFFAWLTQRSKGDSEQEIALIGQWKELTAALSSRVATLEAQVVELTRQNEGLRRDLAQHSQSAAVLLGDLKGGSGGQ